MHSLQSIRLQAIEIDMASLTVRQIDDALKQQLRLRAARHGRSVEDEVRNILRDAAGDTETPRGTRRRADRAKLPPPRSACC